MKLTLDTFKSNLKDGKYKNAGGARKALGKAQDISAEDKLAAQGLINKKFPETATKTAGAKKAAKAPRAAKKAAAPKAARQPRVQKVPKPEHATLEDSIEATRGGFSPSVRLAALTIERTSSAMNAMQGASALAHVEIAEAVEDMNSTLLFATNVLRNALHELEGKTKHKASKTAPASSANGVAPAGKAAEDFAASLPGN